MQKQKHKLIYFIKYNETIWIIIFFRKVVF